MTINHIRHKTCPEPRRRGHKTLVTLCELCAFCGNNYLHEKHMKSDNQKILIRVPNWIGDAVISTGFIEACKKKHPEASITILAHQRVAELFEADPRVNDIIAFSKEEGLRRIVRSIKSRGFDRAYILPLSFSSALMFRLAGIKQRIGYGSELRGLLLTESLKYSQNDFRSRHILQGYAALLGPDVAPKAPKIYLTDDEKGKAEKRIFAIKAGPEDLVGFGPGAAYGPAKMWLAENWIRLGRKLSEGGKKVMIFGSASESELCRDIALGIGHGTSNLAGELSLRESAALLSLTPSFVTNDTGVMHLAAACGARVTAIFGSTSPVWTGPWGEGHRIIYNQEPCSPCYKRICRYGHYNCLKKITPDDVLAG